MTDTEFEAQQTQHRIKHERNERATKPAGFHWCPGMRIAQVGAHVSAIAPDGALLVVTDHPDEAGTLVMMRYAPSGFVPDMDDDATKGAYLGLVRETLGEPNAYPVYNRYWSLYRPTDDITEPYERLRNTGEWGVTGRGPVVRQGSEADILVAALEAASCRLAPSPT